MSRMDAPGAASSPDRRRLKSPANEGVVPAKKRYWHRTSDWPNIKRLEKRAHSGIKKGLGNTRTLLKALGRPDQSYPIVLIAGTNGKGSVGAILAHAMKASGNVVGWYTSPHLVEPLERIWIDGAHIGAGALDLLLNEAFEAERAEGVEATYFELMTLAAFSAFRMTGVELAIVEVGLGGRWDATNACDPLLSVLTNVGLDHQQYLGSTLEAIAAEKLCVAREGHTLVVGPDLDPEWLRFLLECRPAIFSAPAIQATEVAWDHSMVEGHRLNLAGAHQLQNLATALEVIRHLRCLGFPIPEAAMWEGIEQTQWPGRLWQVPGLEDVWMDGAHNPAGAEVLANHALVCGVSPKLFFGAMKDKDLLAMKAQLMRMNPLSVTGVTGQGERWADAAALRSVWGSELEVLDIRQTAARLKENSDATRLVTGSLYLLGDLLRELHIFPKG